MFAMAKLLPPVKRRAVSVGEERMVRANGVELRAQAFGDPLDPAVLLIMGATASMKRWPDEFCYRLAEAGRYVIRYDNRDVGRSTTFPVGAPGYTVRDLADDAVGLLDAYGLMRAHVVGWSMGGMIAQNMAIFHPNRVASAFLFATTLDGSGIGNGASGAGKDSGVLPLPTERVFELMAHLAEVDWTDKKQAVDAWVYEDLMLIGAGDGPEPGLVRANAELVVSEARDLLAHRRNHPIVVATSYWRDRLKSMRTPTLVMHGTDDYCFPLAHAEALAREIAGAELVVVEGMGHVLSPTSAYWDVFADAVLTHSAR